MTGYRDEAERLHELNGHASHDLAAGIGALTQATLYLAEQQRIANLIAAHATETDGHQTWPAIDGYGADVRDEVALAIWPALPARTGSGADRGQTAPGSLRPRRTNDSTSEFIERYKRMIATVTVNRVIRETHEVEFDQDDYLAWLDDGSEPDEDSLAEYFMASRDWECQFTDDTMTGAEPWDADVDGATPIIPFVPKSMDAHNG